MKYRFNLLFAGLATIMGSYLSWRCWQPNLDEHWHVVDEELHNGQCAVDYIKTIDFVSHGEFVINNYPSSDFRRGGTVNRLTRSAEIYSGCYSLYFNYYFESTRFMIIELADPAGRGKPLVLRAQGNIFKCIH
ncbi:MAG: hypothetical protein AAF597_01830 [Bacteroidota bacterium]